MYVMNLMYEAMSWSPNLERDIYENDGIYLYAVKIQKKKRLELTKYDS